MATQMSQADKNRRLCGPYLDAGWGLKNHWYPGLFSHEIADGEVKGIQIAGEPILLRRAKGRVHALLDRCVHRGVKLSLKPTCLTEDTVSCWYHGFTYNLEDGGLSHSVGTPEQGMIDQAFDRRFLDVLCSEDNAALAELSDAEMRQAGSSTGEVRAWIMLAGAFAERRAEQVFYQPIRGFDTGCGQVLIR